STNDPSKWDGRTIEIDDAGTGDLVGDAFIGFRDTRKEKIFFHSIPVGLYNKDNKDNDRPKKHILKVVMKALKKLNHTKGDRILICRGDCFNLVREYFNENDIYYEPAIIEGKLQDAVEEKFITHLRKLGVSSKKLSKEAGIQRYFILFDWLCRDFPNRERFVKTGFPSWKKKWRKIALKKYKSYQGNNHPKINKIKQRANEINTLMCENSISLKKYFSELI
ncbi:MAG: hypothetical protein ACFFDF_15310, partial [Candidatus Odinarchaeota archaeon]